jgi:hypothetical protein
MQATTRVATADQRQCISRFLEALPKLILFNVLAPFASLYALQPDKRVSSKSDSHGALRGADGHPRAIAVLPMHGNTDEVGRAPSDSQSITLARIRTRGPGGLIYLQTG